MVAHCSCTAGIGIGVGALHATRLGHGHANIRVERTRLRQRWSKRFIAAEQRTAAGSTAGMVEVGIFPVMAALKPDPQDGETGEADDEDDDHDDPLVVIGPPTRC